MLPAQIGIEVAEGAHLAGKACRTQTASLKFDEDLTQFVTAGFFKTHGQESCELAKILPIALDCIFR